MRGTGNVICLDTVPNDDLTNARGGVSRSHVLSPHHDVSDSAWISSRPSSLFDSMSLSMTLVYNTSGINTRCIQDIDERNATSEKDSSNKSGHCRIF